MVTEINGILREVTWVKVLVKHVISGGDCVK